MKGGKSMQACTEMKEDGCQEAVSRQQSRCYTVEDLQIMLDISRQSVYALLKKQEFRWFRVGGRYRISKKSFDDWLDTQG